MDIQIMITGRVTIAEDDLKYVEAMGAEELVRVLLIHNAKVETRVSEVYVSDKPKVGADAPAPMKDRKMEVTHGSNRAR